MSNPKKPIEELELYLKRDDGTLTPVTDLDWFDLCQYLIPGEGTGSYTIVVSDTSRYVQRHSNAEKAVFNSIMYEFKERLVVALADHYQELQDPTVTTLSQAEKDAWENFLEVSKRERATFYRKSFEEIAQDALEDVHAEYHDVLESPAVKAQIEKLKFLITIAADKK